MLTFYDVIDMKTLPRYLRDATDMINRFPFEIGEGPETKEEAMLDIVESTLRLGRIKPHEAWPVVYYLMRRFPVYVRVHKAWLQTRMKLGQNSDLGRCIAGVLEAELKKKGACSIKTIIEELSRIKAEAEAAAALLNQDISGERIA